MKYIIAFGRDDVGQKYSSVEADSKLLKTADTLEEACAKREVSGDLVFCADTLKICTNEAWLWEWEKMIRSYARRCLEHNCQLLIR